MPQRTLLALLALASSSAAAQSYSLVVNGQPAPARAIVVNGQTYVPLSALKTLGIPSSLSGTTLSLGTGAAPSTSPGGANGRASLEGCLGETVFNGVWRMTVKSVTPISRYNGQNKGYALNVEWKNGTKATADALNSGVKGFQLILQDGSTLESENVQDLLYRKLAQGAGNTFTLNFYADSAQSPRLTPADRLLVEIDPASSAMRSAYTTPTPSFRVRLACRK
ncbi:hypothetical protein ACFP9V_25520 [Deinococcus radiopugnans]|uniref:Copper amine oxidase N-terminal domain-containing protein n=1 Tax=Deinococcus radiopugnans ATCC 19172 TaxID=585398 RepID=A0A5C4XX70_9DEIO|nr:hypothetical protein [Deinococcus radiopugnans]MBB6018550.1 hypothetical protein [Deinococcus radiopugnans ATCC 19172]TNM67321.1 hypothetical protein FHR04_18545 [Deinococcus radiopugnans ATCC 19172]